MPLRHARFVADAREAQRGLPEDVAHRGVELFGHHPLAEVAEFDHDHHVVDSAANSCGGGERSAARRARC